MVVMSLGLVIILIVSALKPTLVTVAGLLGQIDQEKAIEERVDQKIAVVQKANEELQKYQNRLSILDTAIPQEPAWGDFAQEITQAASESGVELKSLTFGPVGGSTMVPDVLGIVFNLTGAGIYPSLRKFAARIDESRRVTVVSDVTITTDLLSIKGVVGYAPGTGDE